MHCNLFCCKVSCDVTILSIFRELWNVLRYANILQQSKTRQSNKRKLGVSLTIQYKAVTRVDVTPAAVVHPSALPWKGWEEIGKRCNRERGKQREREREGEGERRRVGERERERERHTHTDSPPTIPLAGTVICCMHASRDG